MSRSTGEQCRNHICKGVIPRESVLITEIPDLVRNCIVSMLAPVSMDLWRRVSPLEDSDADKSTPRSTKTCSTSMASCWNSSILFSNSKVHLAFDQTWEMKVWHAFVLAWSNVCWNLMVVGQGHPCRTDLLRDSEKVGPFCTPRHRNSWHNEGVCFHNHLCCWVPLHFLSNFLPFLDYYLTLLRSVVETPFFPTYHDDAGFLVSRDFSVYCFASVLKNHEGTRRATAKADVSSSLNTHSCEKSCYGWVSKWTLTNSCWSGPWKC